MLRSMKISLWWRIRGSLIWLLGVALIVYPAPRYYRTLYLDDYEHVAGFRANSHEIVTVGYQTAPQITGDWQFLPKALTRLPLLAAQVRYGDSIYLRDLDRGTRQRLELTLGSVYALTCCKTGDRLCV